MPAVPAVLIAGIKQGDLSADGQTIALTLTLPDQRELVLAIPRGLVHQLIEMAATGFMRSNAALKIDPAVRAPLTATWWDILTDPTSKQMILDNGERCSSGLCAPRQDAGRHLRNIGDAAG